MADKKSLLFDYKIIQSRITIDPTKNEPKLPSKQSLIQLSKKLSFADGKVSFYLKQVWIKQTYFLYKMPGESFF